MTAWQVDCYRRPVQTEYGQPLWELVVCEPDGMTRAIAWCPQNQINTAWVVDQLQAAAQDGLPSQIRVFRPQTLNLLEEAGKQLGITVVGDRTLPALKQILQQRTVAYAELLGYTGQPYDPLALDSPAPNPVPETLWGDRWRFGAINAADFLPAFEHKPIPLRSIPDPSTPVALGLASTQPIPGVIIDGGRVSMRLARWLSEQNPAFLNYIPGDPDGLILESGLVDRWVLATFDDPEVKTAAKTFQERQHKAQGLHFLLVQPDDSGITYSGLWLLRRLS